MTKPTVAPGNGVVRGSVRFFGPKPTVKIIGGDCCPGVAPAVDESLVVNDQGKLKNVVVYIKDGPNITTDDAGETVLTQKECRYVPHVKTVRTGQTLVVTSQDPTVHNIHIEADDGSSDNFSEQRGGSHAVHFDHAGQVRFKCDVHPWMTAYVMVFDHPCFAVTDEAGRFEIGRLPPGSYSLVALQEKLGEVQKQFTVTDGKPVELDFEFKP